MCDMGRDCELRLPAVNAEECVAFFSVLIQVVVKSTLFFPRGADELKQQSLNFFTVLWNGEKYVELPVRRLDRVGHTRHVALAAGIGPKAVGTFTELSDSGIEHLSATACDKDDGPVFDQALGSTEAKTGGSTSNQSCPPLQ
jgi:hypothetical protein